MPIPEKDKTILRRLAEKVAKIAALPIQTEKAEMWRRLNGLERVKPMIWVNEIPWHEMDVNDELKIQTSDPFCRGLEGQLRRIIYQWEHMRGDMVVEEKIYSSLAIRDTGLGIGEDVDIVKTDERSGIVSRTFHPQIQEEKDIEKIKMPEITHDVEASEHNYQRVVDIFDDIIPVEKRGVPGRWFAPWDELIRWWGVQEAMMDLVLRPELVHKAVDRLVSAHLHRLDQWEELNLLSLNSSNVRIGSGGFGYSDELPPNDFNPAYVRAIDIWGCATAQIFSEVSPEMHEEFALQYERRWLERFGLTYYGCCEPLDIKMQMLKSVPNLRKVSMSTWINIDRAVEEVGDSYVFSYKPNPDIFARDVWNPELARKNLQEVLEKTQDCVVEIIMKDISTVCYEPQRLWEWVSIAEEMCDMVGPERTLMAMIDDPDWVKDMFMTDAQLCVDIAEEMMGRGFEFHAGWIFDDLGFKHKGFFSTAMYRELLMPAHKLICDCFKSREIPMLLHSCGYVTEFFPLFVEAGFDCIQPLEVKAGNDILELKKQYGDVLSFMGGIDIRMMASEDPDDIVREISTKLPAVKHGGGYIYHSDHSVPDNVSFQQYCRVMKLVSEYGAFDS